MQQNSSKTIRNHVTDAIFNPPKNLRQNLKSVCDVRIYFPLPTLNIPYAKYNELLEQGIKNACP